MTNKTYRNRDERIEIGKLALELAPSGARPSMAQMRAVARQLGIGVSIVTRGVKEVGTPTPPPRAWQPPHELLVRIAMHQGKIQPALRELSAERAAQGAPDLLPPYSTVARAVHRDLGLQAAMREGPEALQKFLLVGEHEPAYRNEIIYMDATKLPILCRDQYDRKIEDLWFISAFDAYSRLVVAHAICIGEVTGQLTADVYLASALGREIHPDELQRHGMASADRIFVGGVSEMTVLDNALVNKSDVVGDNVHLAGSRFQFARPHMATDKAKLERYHRTLKFDLAPLPANTKGASPLKSDERDSRQYGMPPGPEYPRVEAVIMTTNTLVEDYNWNHVISTTGQTPMQRFLADTTPIRLVPPAIAWRSLQTRGEYKVHPRGVKVDHVYRTTAHADFQPGTTVEVRTLPGQPGRMFFGVGGRFAAEITPHREQHEDEMEERRARNAKIGRTARSILREAGRILKEEGLPEAPVGDLKATAVAPPPPQPAPRRRGEQPITDEPSVEALQGLPWNPPTEEDAA